MLFILTFFVIEIYDLFCIFQNKKKNKTYNSVLRVYNKKLFGIGNKKTISKNKNKKKFF